MFDLLGISYFTGWLRVLAIYAGIGESLTVKAMGWKLEDCRPTVFWDGSVEWNKK